MPQPSSLFNQALRLHQQSQWGQAKQGYLNALKKQPNNVPAMVNLGAVYRQLNQPKEALSILEKAVSVDPRSSEAWFNYGNLCIACKDYAKAEQCFFHVIKIDPKSIKARYQLAIQYRAQTQWTKTLSLLQEIIELEPTHADGLLELGNTHQHLGNAQHAFSCYRTLVDAHPHFWKGQYSLARWHDMQGDKKACHHHLNLAIESGAQPWFVHQSLAQSRMDAGQYQLALEQFQAALNIEPNHPRSLIGAGSCFMQLQQADQAKKYFGIVSSCEDVSILSELARVVWEYKFFDESIKILEKMVSLRPDLADTHLNLAKAYYHTWKTSKARYSLDKALSLRDNYQEAEDLLTDLLNRQGRSSEGLPMLKARVQRDGSESRSVSTYLFTELYSDKVSAKEKAEHHRALTASWNEEKREHTFTNKREKTRCLKVGFVSADFRDQHPVGIFSQALFQHYNKKHFEFFAYYTSRTLDDSTHEIKAQLDHWVDAASWSDERLRSRIIEDGIDILIDLSGHTSKHRLRMFAMRCAPVQVTWMGYPHSTGLREMDYLIADKIVCPPDKDELCSERVMRLDSHAVFCFPETSVYPEPSPTMDIDSETIVFGSFNNLTKMNPSILQLWYRLLDALPQAKLKMKAPSFADEECREEFIRYFVEKGIDEHRLMFSGPSSLKDMMLEYNQVDIALDTFPYNGGTTSFQALWMGVPVLTLKGENFCGRMGASVMSHLGLPDWIAKDETDFINVAMEKATNRRQLLELKAGLRDRMTHSPLCDSAGFCVDFEGLLLRIWQGYCEDDSGHVC